MIDLNNLKLSNIENAVFKYFSDICDIPHGSGNRVPIADYCENFAQNHNLRYVRDNSNNVVIFKDGQAGGENTEPIILQGHLDMVCQNTPNREIDFLKEGIKILRDGDYIKADGTTLGADNGIAVAYILAILASKEICHPPIEAVLTADEEIGLLGASELDMNILKARKMINLDSETEDVLTVSCAGGADVIATLPLNRENTSGFIATLNVYGLLGGHSGVEIDKGRINANILLGKILKILHKYCDYRIVAINGGKKPNAIPDSATVTLCTDNPKLLESTLTKFKKQDIELLKKAEPDICINLELGENGAQLALDRKSTDDIITLLTTVPDGVIKMSEEITGLVETSLNLGILITKSNSITLHYALRSNKQSELEKLCDNVIFTAQSTGATTETDGFYPPWEFKPNSNLRELYKECFKELYDKNIKVEAIHAGLECAVFSAKIKNLDCISVGPNIYNVHTPNEKLSISSAVNTFKLILKVLQKSCNL